MLDILRNILAVIGGVGVIVIGLSKLLGGILRDHINEKNRRGTELRIESYRNQLASRRIQADQFLKSQYDVYIELWKSLQGLRLTVDALWQRANRNNIAELANQLRYMRTQLSNWSLFFEEANLEELNRLLNILENFEEGKMRLILIRSNEDVTQYFQQMVEHQIEQNRRYKEEFDKMLEEIRVSFKERLSRLEHDA